MRHVQLFQAVETVARLGSIRRAAEALAISPSALNRQILALEADAGAALFERTARGVRLSTAGEIYLAVFRRHQGDLEQAASQVADLSGLRAGAVRVAVSEELAGWFLPGVVAAYLERHPKVTFEAIPVAFDQVGEALSSFEADVALAADPQIGGDVETIFAVETTIVGVVAEEATPDGPLGLAELLDRPLLAPSARSGLRNAIDAGFVARRADATISLSGGYGADATARRLRNAVLLALDAEAEAMDVASAGLRAAPVRPGLFKRPVARVMRARGRGLPVAADRFAVELSRSLAAAVGEGV